AGRSVRHRRQEAGADHQIHRGGWVLFGASLSRGTRRALSRQRAGSLLTLVGLAATPHPVSSPSSTRNAHRPPAGTRALRVRAAGHGSDFGLFLSGISENRARRAAVDGHSTRANPARHPRGRTAARRDLVAPAARA